MEANTGIIVAMSKDRVIGLHGRIPWHYQGDLRRFQQLTMHKAIIMGRNTWDSLPQKPLKGRRNIVISHKNIPGIEAYPSLADALCVLNGQGKADRPKAKEGRFSHLSRAQVNRAQSDKSQADDLSPSIWFIGGTQIYAEALSICRVIDITFVPDHIRHSDAIYFPLVDFNDWEVGPLYPHPDEIGLECQRLVRHQTSN